MRCPKWETGAKGRPACAAAGHFDASCYVERMSVLGSWHLNSSCAVIIAPSIPRGEGFKEVARDGQTGQDKKEDF